LGQHAAVPRPRQARTTAARRNRLQRRLVDLDITQVALLLDQPLQDRRALGDLLAQQLQVAVTLLPLAEQPLILGVGLLRLGPEPLGSLDVLVVRAAEPVKLANLLLD